MPDRIIRESICTSDTIDRLSWFEEVFWHRLTVNCDDYGRFDARPAVLKSRLFPLKESVTMKSVEEALNKLSTVGLVMPYVCDGRPYLQLVTWEKYQRIRAKKSKYPSPDGTCCRLTASDGNSVRNPIQAKAEAGSESQSNAGEGASPYVKAVQAFVAMREQYGKPMGRDAIVILQNQLEQMAPGDREQQRKLLEQSVVKGWMDIYPLGSRREQQRGENDAKDAAAKYGRRGTVL